MAVSGFEGFEKRLELHFFGDDPKNVGLGLRLLDFESLDEDVLQAVQCTVVSAVANHYFDAYVLSESSLFVYPTKIIIKTCGTTQLLKSVAPLLRHASSLGLTLTSCRYTRGNFIFPGAQPFPHDTFQNEVVYLEDSLPHSLCYRKASVMPSKIPLALVARVLRFHRSDVVSLQRGPGDGKSGDTAGKEMTEITGIGEINPGALICDFAFDPCGYSMNGIDGDRHSTIHVTPEDGFSYASFECVGHEVWTRVAGALEPLGMKCRSCALDEFPAAGNVAYQTFTARRK
ncbi:hypothetical protein M0R45_020729 [Rubus argutus]|uniref:adenosylmethionine decarboxylase n=1 Tax=Rubus argutus TaxID=59490 RepID=A0AAW1XB48_RUBAR